MNTALDAEPPRARFQPSVAEKTSADIAAGDGSAGWLQRFLSRARPEDYRRGFYAFAAVVVGLFLLVNLHGPCLQAVYGHDDMCFLNAAWKVRCGVWPHADYHSAMGALDPWMHAAGMWLLGPTASVLPFCNTLAGVAIGLLAWVVASRRLPAWVASLFALTQAVVAMSPLLLRFEWFSTTYDGYYNRQGYALVSTLLLLLFLPRRGGEDDKQGARWDGRITGAILGVLLFHKVSYCMAGAGLCGVAGLGGRRFSRALGWNLLAAFGVVTACCLPLIRFDVVAMWRDLGMAAGARSASPDAALTVGGFLAKLPDAWVEVALLATMQLMLTPPGSFRRNADSPRALPGWVEFAGVVGASMFIGLTNSSGGERSETPLLTSWLFVLVGGALRTTAGRFTPPDGARPNFAVLCSLAAVLWVFTFGYASMSLVWSALPWTTPWQRMVLKFSPRFDAEPLEDLRILGDGGEAPLPSTYAAKVNDGLALLRKLGGTHRVEAFDFVNPFPFALQWPAVHGGLWCWQNGYTFSATSHPPPEEAFGDADVLMVPKYPGETASFEVMTRVYTPYLKERFRLTAQSDQWYLLQRR